MIRHQDFLVQLENFRHESYAAAQYIYAEMAIQHAASKSKKLLNKLNDTPRFWIVCGASLQSAAYISLGRVFDTTSNYNVNALLNSMENNLHAFQRDALAERKRDGKSEDPEWLAEYLENAHYPNIKDITRLRGLIAKYRLIYERAVRPVRNKYLAHREKEDAAEIKALFAAGTIKEFWRLTTFLLQLNEMLWEQYYNGRKPVLRPVRHSVKSIFDAEHQRSTPHESIISDVKKLMYFIEHAKVSI